MEPREYSIQLPQHFRSWTAFWDHVKPHGYDPDFFMEYDEADRHEPIKVVWYRTNFVKLKAFEELEAARQHFGSTSS